MKVCLSCQSRFDSADWQCPYCNHMPTRSGRYLSFSPDLARTNDGFSEESFARLVQLEASSFWFKSRNRLLLWAFRTYFPDARSFLEIGCGTGFVLSCFKQVFPGLGIAGSEIFTEGLSFAEQRLPGASLFQMDARQIPYEQEFDMLGAFDMLEHVEGDETVLQQMFQASKPGGGIILTVPQHRFLWSAMDDLSFHKRRYSREDLIKKVVRAGFAILRVTSFVSLLLPLMLLSRLKKRAVSANFDPASEFKVSPVVNVVLEEILGFERLWIERGASFPAGGSLLLVARRPGITRQSKVQS